jgi:hypothetical protein
MKKPLAYCGTELITGKRRFIRQAPSVDVIRPFRVSSMAVVLNKLECLYLTSVKVRAYPSVTPNSQPLTGLPTNIRLVQKRDKHTSLLYQ